MNEFAKMVAQYNSTLPTLADGKETALQVDSSGRLIITTSGASLSVDDNGSSLTVDGSVSVSNFPATQAVSASDLDIRDLSAAQDNVAISDGSDTLAIAADGSIAVSQNGSWTVTVQEPLSIDDNGSSITVDNAGTFAVQVDGDALTALQLIDDIVQEEDAVHVDGDKGVMALGVRQDTQADLGADGDYVPLSIDADGAVRVSGTFAAQVDDVFESGTEADSASDSAGDGIVAISGASMTTVATLSVGAGTTAYLVGCEFVADEQTRWELIVDDNGTPSEWIRAGAIDGLTEVARQFPRAIEITGAANRSVLLRAQRLATGSANAAGAINAYTR